MKKVALILLFFYFFLDVSSSLLKSKRELSLQHTPIKQKNLIFEIEKNVLSDREKAYKIIDNINIENYISDVCIAYPQYCYILTDPIILGYIKKYHKAALKAIIEHESWGFRFKRGVFDEDDVCYMMVNLYYWPIKYIRRLNVDVNSEEDLINNLEICIEVGTKIWLVNVGLYIHKTRKYPRNLAEYAALYHNPLKIKRYYVRKIKKKIYKYLN